MGGWHSLAESKQTQQQQQAPLTESTHSQNWLQPPGAENRWLQGVNELGLDFQQQLQASHPLSKGAVWGMVRDCSWRCSVEAKHEVVVAGKCSLWGSSIDLFVFSSARPR